MVTDEKQVGDTRVNIKNHYQNIEHKDINGKYKSYYSGSSTLTHWVCLRVVSANLGEDLRE